MTKLKEKLVNFFGKEIQFWQPNYKSEIVYSSALDTEEAVEAAYEAANSENRILEEATSILFDTSKLHSQEIPWPPSENFLILA